MSGPGEPLQPQGDYVLARRHGGMIFSAGMTPRRNGEMQAQGPVRAANLESFRAAAELACANALKAIEAALSPGESLVAVLSMTVYVAAEPGFDAHSRIADFASAHLRAKLGARGACARVAVGVASLPGNAPLEIQLVAAV